MTDDAEELILSGLHPEQAYTQSPEQIFSMGESMINGVLREVEEEVGLAYPASHAQLVHQLDHYQCPMITNIYLIKAGTNIDPPLFKVDGNEIAEAMWAKLQAFRFEFKENNTIHVIVDYYDAAGEIHPVEVTMMYALLLGRAIQAFRDGQLQQISPLFANRTNVEAKINRILASPTLNPT
ncbi:MAG TPA: NUDIX domain-containing protein, partial [Legionellaceae bacterium]|nr:NUDIX domain-containing protein [Legionellaceae bacterium]